MMRDVYIIDGVAVIRKIWERRRMFGEYQGADFYIWETPSERASDKIKRERDRWKPRPTA